MKEIEAQRLSAWLDAGGDGEERKAEEFDANVWCRHSQMQQRMDLLVALDRAITDFNNERGGSIAEAWNRTGQRDLFKVHRLLKALPERERLLEGVKDQVKRHRSKQAAQVDQVVERTRLAGAGGAVAAVTLPVAPAGADGPGSAGLLSFNQKMSHEELTSDVLDNAAGGSHRVSSGCSGGGPLCYIIF